MHPLPLFRCIESPLRVFLILATPAVAQTATPGTNAQESAYRSSVAQESVRKQTDKIQAEITELAAELKLNGVDISDMNSLSNASNHLRALSQDDMQKVINSLQSASMNAQDQERQQSLVNAYQGQKAVSLKLKSLAADLAAQESQKEIPSKLENLIARQSANIRHTSTFSTTSPDQLNVQQKSTHDVASAEQSAIGGEIDILFKVLAAKPDAPAAGDAPDISKTVLDALNSSALKDTTQAATQLTTAGPFPDAVTKQTAVREYLTSVLRVSLSNIDEVTRLEEVKAQLNQLINDQKDLTAVTQQSKLDGPLLAERQAKINDRTSVTEALLKPINAGAFNQVAQAQQAMDQSSSALTKATNPSDTAPQLQTVADALQKAESLLEQLIAAAEKQQTLSPVDKLAQLEQLKSDINQAEKNPQVSPTDLQKLQQEAMTPSPQAANKIADAADKLQQPQPDTPAADKLLAQASDAVQQQEDALKQAAQDYQALAQASQQLDKAQQQAAAANQAMQNNNNTEAARDLAQAQANVNQTQQAPPAGLPPDAQQALQQASDALKNATNQAVQAQDAQAQAQNQKAMAAMQKAQAGLAQAMAQAQGQGQGQGQGPGQGQGQPGQTQPGQGMASEAPQQGTGVLGGAGAGGVAQVIGGLTTKDRDAITQFQAEKSPPEYASQVQQYLKNLADTSDSH